MSIFRCFLLPHLALLWQIRMQWKHEHVSVQLNLWVLFCKWLFLTLLSVASTGYFWRTYYLIVTPHRSRFSSKLCQWNKNKTSLKMWDTSLKKHHIFIIVFLFPFILPLCKTLVLIKHLKQTHVLRKALFWLQDFNEVFFSSLCALALVFDKIRAAYGIYHTLIAHVTKSGSVHICATVQYTDVCVCLM